MLTGAAIVAGLVTAGVLPMFFEESFLFHPTREMSAAPSEYGLAHEDVWLRTGETRIHSWHLRPIGGLTGGTTAGTASATPGRATVVFFHGNAGTIADRLPHATAWIALGFEVLLVECPGYGRSGGEPSEPSITAMADAAYTWARARGKPVVAFGESLGGAVAIGLAARQKLNALVVQSTFTSVADMAKVLLPWVPFEPPLRNRFDSIAVIHRVEEPTLILHGDQDELVPFPHGERLFAAAGGPKRFVKLEGAGHNDTIDKRASEYFGAIDTFLRTHGL